MRHHLRPGPHAARRLRANGVGAGPGVACVLALLVAVAACGSPDAAPSSSTSNGGSSTPESTPPGASPSPSDAGPSTPSGSIRLSGIIRTSPEDRVVALEARAGGGRPATTWTLIGPVRSLQDGERVTVVGRPAPDADTTTQRGPIFQVESVER